MVAEKILVVDDDPDIALLVRSNLSRFGYEVDEASDGVEALEKARAGHPDLVVLDIMLPKMDGFQVLQRLRSDPKTADVSVIMLSGRVTSADKVLALTEGADGYIIKPFELVELVARVKGALNRARELRARSPLTGLPGNVRIQDELEVRIREHRPFALIYADLDNFKAFNDKYGFLRGDAAIQFAARVVEDVAIGVAGEDVFVGHLGGDDFVVICTPEAAQDICRRIAERVDREAPDLYDPDDRERGFISVTDRQGRVQRFPLLSVSIGVATTDRREFMHQGEAVSVATELKEYAKQRDGSVWAVDRRRASR